VLPAKPRNLRSVWYSLSIVFRELLFSASLLEIIDIAHKVDAVEGVSLGNVYEAILVQT
jgi:hypothetical protein